MEWNRYSMSLEWQIKEFIRSLIRGKKKVWFSLVTWCYVSSVFSPRIKDVQHPSRSWLDPLSFYLPLYHLNLTHFDNLIIPWQVINNWMSKFVLIYMIFFLTWVSSQAANTKIRPLFSCRVLQLRSEGLSP